jgi:arylsulfatase A
MVLPTLAQRAASWLDEHARQADRRPFFLYFALTSPHTPIAPSTRWRGASEAGAYGDFVAETDWALGVVLDALARNGFAGDTLVVFSSDNGSPRFDGEGMQGEPDAVIARYGHDPSRPWRGRKGELYEGGHRVPLIVRWPRVVTGPAVADRLVSLTDLYRTIAGSWRGRARARIRRGQPRSPALAPRGQATTRTRAAISSTTRRTAPSGSARNRGSSSRSA